MPRINVLLIQEDPPAAKAVRDALSGSFQVEWVKCCLEGVERLSGKAMHERPGIHGIGAVLLDLFLPDSQGIETFDRLFRTAPQVPILVLSTSQDEDIAKLAVQHGAQDYVLKTHLDASQLPKALERMVERAAIAEAMFDERERAQVALNSIGDAVMSTDVSGKVIYLNGVAESLTGWSRNDALDHPVEEVFRIINATTREGAHSNHSSLLQGRATLLTLPVLSRWTRKNDVK